MASDYMKRYNMIKERFGEKAFTINDLCKLLNIKNRMAYGIMYCLKKENLIAQPLRGLYKACTPKTVSPAKDIEGIRKHLLKRITRKFSFTGLSILESFIHHMPYVLIYHLFVEPGSAEDFETEIKEVSKITTLIEPSLNDISLVLNNLHVNKLIIIRENNYFYSSKGGLSSKEAAFTDLYFEITRERVPIIKTDLEEVFKSLAINNLINYSTLTKYAKQRGIKEEIKKFLRKMSSATDIPPKVLR